MFYCFVVDVSWLLYVSQIEYCIYSIELYKRTQQIVKSEHERQNIIETEKEVRSDLMDKQSKEWDQFIVQTLPDQVLLFCVVSV